MSEWLTIEVAAKQLNVSAEDIHKMFINGMHGWTPLLKPSVYFQYPLLMIDISNYKEGCLVNKIDPLDINESASPFEGLFQIRNYASVLREINDNLGYLNLADIPLFRGENVYIVQGAAKIHKDNLLIALDDFEQFKQGHGIQSHVTANPVTESEEEYTRRMQQSMVKPSDIAKGLKSTFPKITAHRIGALLPANPGLHVSPEANKKQGQRLLK